MMNPSRLALVPALMSGFGSIPEPESGSRPSRSLYSYPSGDQCPGVPRKHPRNRTKVSSKASHHNPRYLKRERNRRRKNKPTLEQMKKLRETHRIWLEFINNNPNITKEERKSAKIQIFGSLYPNNSSLEFRERQTNRLLRASKEFRSMAQGETSPEPIFSSLRSSTEASSQMKDAAAELNARVARALMVPSTIANRGEV